VPAIAALSGTNRFMQGLRMDPNLGSLIVAELVLALVDEFDAMDPGARERLYVRAIKRAREADHDRTPEVVAALEAMRQGTMGS
jgi:hypothetical protein